MRNLKTKKLTKKICLALACGLVFTAGGQLNKAEAEDSKYYLYGAEEGEVEGVTANNKGVKTFVGGSEPAELDGSITTGADFVVNANNWDSVYGGYVYNVNTEDLVSIHDNSVTVTGGKIGDVYGGLIFYGDGSHTIKDNTVTIKEVTINGNIYGGIANHVSDGGNLQITGNKVFIDGGTITAPIGFFNCIIGGYANLGYGDVNTKNNEVHISDGTVNARRIAGGAFNETSGTSAVTGNKVIISGGTVAGSLSGTLNIYGGLAESTNDEASGKIVTANENIVEISGGTVTGNVYGGFAGAWGDTATASRNTVEISGGTVTGNVYGGLAQQQGDQTETPEITLKAENNTVTLGNKNGAGVADIRSNSGIAGSGSVYINAICPLIEEKHDMTDVPGGTLNVYNVGNKVGGALYASGANINFYIPKDAVSDNILLTANAPVLENAAINIKGFLATKVTLIKGVTFKINRTGAKYFVGGTQIKIQDDGTGQGTIITDNKDYLLTAKATLQVSDSEIMYSGTPQFLAGSITAPNGKTQYAGGRTSSVVNIDADTFIPVIEGAKKCQIVGAFTMNGSPAKDGTIDLKATRDLSDYGLWGGESITPDRKEQGPVSGNTLNVRALNIKANSVQNFDALNFYVPKTAVNGDTMLKVKTAAIGGSTIRAGVATGSELKKNDTINLLVTDTLTGNASGMKADIIGTGLVKIDGTVKQDGNNIVLVMNEDIKKDDPKPDPKPDPLAKESKSLVETRAGGMAMLNTGADFVVGKGMTSAQAAAEAESNAQTGDSGTRSNEAVRANAGFTPYAAVGAANMTYETGSYVDSKGWGVNVGFSRIIYNKNSKLTLAPFIEYGKSSYDSYLDNGTHGSGDNSFTGIGFMAKNEQKDGLYYEGSVRFGRSKGDYQGDASIYGSNYDTASNYLAFHAGIGKVQKLSEKSSLDYYGKLFYTHQNGDTVNIKSSLGDASYDFDAINSCRLRLGARWNQKLGKRDVFYAGLAWDYEFDSEARAHYNGASTPAPSMKGSSGMLELGWKQETTKDNPFGVDLNLGGWCGKQKGITFNAGFSWAF